MIEIIQDRFHLYLLSQVLILTYYGKVSNAAERSNCKITKKCLY